MRAILLLLILIAVLSSCNNSETANKTEMVPQERTEKSFEISNPNAKDVSWEKDGEFVEVEFTENGIEKSILYNSEGNVVESETEIDVDQLPEAILLFIADNYPEAEIEEAETLENTEGSFFEVEIENQNEGETELLFSADGVFVKEVLEHDDDDEHEHGGEHEHDDGDEHEHEHDDEH